MNKKIILFLAIVFSIFMFATLFNDKPMTDLPNTETDDYAEEEITLKENINTAVIKDQVLTPKKKDKSKPKPINENDKQVNTSEKIEEQALSIIEYSRFDSTPSLKAGIVALKKLPREDIADDMISSFSTSTGKPVLREKIIWYAKKLNGPEFFPLWHNVIYRTNPRFANESLEEKKHLDPDQSIAEMEQLLALEALGEISSKESDNLLRAIALGGKDVPGISTGLRMEAVRAMRKKNRNSIIQISALLESDDPVRKQLQAWARSRRTSR